MANDEKVNTEAGKKLKLLRHWFYREDRQVEVNVLYEVSSYGECKLFTINKITECLGTNSEGLIRACTGKDKLRKMQSTDSMDSALVPSLLTY